MVRKCLFEHTYHSYQVLLLSFIIDIDCLHVMTGWPPHYRHSPAMTAGIHLTCLNMYLSCQQYSNQVICYFNIIISLFTHLKYIMVFVNGRKVYTHRNLLCFVKKNNVKNNQLMRNISMNPSTSSLLTPFQHLLFGRLAYR